jgi:peptide/nickel transport system permease protein/oligopeptide transport system permease protein
MAVPIDVATGPGGPEPTPAPAVAGKAIEGRSLGQIAWMRLRQDKVAMAGGIVVIFLILVAIFGPYLVQNPLTYHENLIDPTFSRPFGTLGGISAAHPFGVEPITGRDLLARVVNGARVSLVIAFLSTALAVSIGVVMGVIAGFFGGWVDSVIARAMDIFLAFPLLVFAIALVGVIPSSAFGLSGNSLRIGLLVFVIGFFAWPYMGRIIRGQTLSLREREFVDAARSLGARGPYILFRELLPNLTAPIVISISLMLPAFVAAEAGLAFLGIGVTGSASWGQTIANAVPYWSNYPLYLWEPLIGVVALVLALNLLGDAVRDAFDPKTRR